MLVGIGGYKGSGKSTLADMLLNYIHQTHIPPEMAYYTMLSQKTQLCNFADAIRETAARAFNVKPEYFVSNKGETNYIWNMTRREMLLRTGEAFRSLDPLFWIKRWEMELLPNYHVICADVRTEEEAHAILQRNGLLVLVQRPGVEWDGSEMESLPMRHPELFSIVVHNTSLEALRAAIPSLTARRKANEREE